jgi:hypothetical protein
MPGGFAPRFAIEAGFLIALGVGAGIADLRPQVIVALLAGGWVLVSLIELSAWRAEGRMVAPRMSPLPAESESEPELEVGWPLEEPHEAEEEAEEEAYPLRRDTDVRDAEAEEYTRVIAKPDRAPDEAESEARGSSQ